MIELTDITQRYGHFTAVRDMSFSIDSGEVIGLVGPNGAGKTTTMKIVTGYLIPTEGRVSIDGIDVITNPSSAQQRIGYLPESAPLYPEMTVQDYLLFIGKMRGLSGAHLRERLAFAVDACGIREKLTQPVRTLSKGLRQRAGIAQAIIHDPKILILDEPTSGLDPNQIVEIRDLIRELGRDKTVILSTHILAEVEETCSRAIMVVGGQIAADDELTNLCGGTDVRFAIEESSDGVAEVLGSLDCVADVGFGRDGEFIVTPSEETSITADLHRLAVAKGWTVTTLAAGRRSLEDVFREVSGTDRTRPAVATEGAQG